MSTLKGGRPPYAPTPKDRATVKAMAGYGIPHDDIAAVIGATAKTLRKHFRDELDLAATQANAAVAQRLFQVATAGTGKEAVTAAIFWLKARAGWRDATKLEHSGTDGGPVQIVLSADESSL